MRAVVGGLLAVVVVLAGGTSAQAHPFGDPQTVVIGAAGEVVTVEWRVGGQDDLTLLGIELGVLPEDRVLLDGAIMFEDGDTAAVSASPELRDYLLDRITVESEGDPCAGEVVQVGDLAEESASLEFTCPGPVGSASVAVRMLTDLHPAYRTLATGPDGQRAVYESAADSHDWSLGAAQVAAPASPSDEPSTAQQNLGRSAALQLGAVGAALLLVVVGAVALRRRSRSSHHSPHTT